MAEPLVIQFAADTSRAQSAMTSLAASIIGNMTATSVAMQGATANSNSFGGAIQGLAQNAARAAAAVGADVKSIGSATAGAAAAQGATLQSVTAAFTAAAVSSNTAAAGVKTGISSTSTAISTLAAQLPVLAYLGAGVGVAAAAYLTITTAVEAANKQLEEFVALGAEAEKTGLGVEFLQRFKEAAKDAKIEVGEIDQALRHASQATTPKFDQDNPVRKQLTDIFETGFTGSFQSKGLADYIGAKDAETRVRAVVTAMQELRDLSLSLAAVDLAEKVFGAATAERIRSGRLDIDAIAEALDRQRDDLISQEQVTTATDFKDRLDDAYEEINKVLATSFAAVEAGKGINNVWLSIVETTAKAAVHAGTFLDNMLKAARAGNNQSELYPRQRGEGEGSLGADLGADAARSGRGRTLYDKPIGPERPAGFITDPPSPPRRPLSFFTEQAAPRASRGGGREASESLDAVETLINQIEKARDTAKAELENVEKTNVEREKAVALAKAEAAAREEVKKGNRSDPNLDDDERARVLAAAEAWQTYKDRTMDAQQALRQAAEASRFFGQAASDAFADAILEGRSFGDVLASLEKQIARAAIQAAFTGQGSLAGLLGFAPKASEGSDAVGGLAGLFKSGLSAFGGDPLPAHFAANGGPVNAGQPTTVGEMGRELFVPDQSGRVYPIIAPPTGGGGSSPAVNVYNNGEPMTAQAQRRQDGSIDVFLDRLEARSAGRIASGRGALAAALPSGRMLRG